MSLSESRQINDSSTQSMPVEVTMTLKFRTARQWQADV